MTRIATAALAAGLFAGAAEAATLYETTDFSSDAPNPTVVDASYDGVAGSLVGGDWDYLALTVPGTAADITLTFALADLSIPNGAGFQLYYSYAPFAYGNNSFVQPYNQWVTQTVTPGSVELSNWGGSGTNETGFTISADPALGSTLYLALSGTHNSNGPGIGYSISLPSVPVAQTPLPAGALLLGSALAGFGALGLRRRMQGRTTA